VPLSYLVAEEKRGAPHPAQVKVPACPQRLMPDIELSGESVVTQGMRILVVILARATMHGPVPPMQNASPVTRVYVDTVRMHFKCPLRSSVVSSWVCRATSHVASNTCELSHMHAASSDPTRNKRL
jgi:hypothetical protein